MKLETDMSFKSLPPNFQMKMMKQHPEKATEILTKNPRVKVILEI